MSGRTVAVTVLEDADTSELAWDLTVDHARQMRGMLALADTGTYEWTIGVRDTPGWEKDREMGMTTKPFQVVCYKKLRKRKADAL